MWKFMNNKKPMQFHPPQTEFGLCRFGNTDFQDKAEFISFANIGPIPVDFANRPGEFQNDMNIVAEEMVLLDFKKGSIEMARALVRMARTIPTA